VEELVSLLLTSGPDQHHPVKARAAGSAGWRPIESGQRRIDVVEFLDLASAIGFDPRDAIKRLSSS